jgi:hypothetical protein
MGLEGLVGLVRAIASTLAAAVRRLLGRDDGPERPAL